MRYSLIFLVALMVLSLGVRYFADPVRLAQLSADPHHDLQELCQREPLLSTALNQADHGDVTELVKWINRAEPAERQRLAFLLLKLTKKPGSADDGALDAALCWQYRHRFRAFLNLDSGSDALDTDIDNLVAYTLITGTDSPSAQDLRLANSLVQRLRHAAQESADDAIMDTVGCVQFASGEFATAKESFALANRYATEARDKSRHEHGTLYTRRLAAADHNAKAKADGRTGEYLPLPPEAEPAATPAKEAVPPKEPVAPAQDATKS